MSDQTSTLGYLLKREGCKADYCCDLHAMAFETVEWTPLQAINFCLFDTAHEKARKSVENSPVVGIQNSSLFAVTGSHCSDITETINQLKQAVAIIRRPTNHCYLL